MHLLCWNPRLPSSQWTPVCQEDNCKYVDRSAPSQMVRLINYLTIATDNGFNACRVSASNSAKLYEMALSNHEYLAWGEWQFVSQLNTDHVWDSIILLALLRDKHTNNSCLEVPHEGKQKDQFTLAMEEWNKKSIHKGQPDAVQHACDKCLRIYIDGEGAVHVYYHCQAKQFLIDLHILKGIARSLSAMDSAWVIPVVGSFAAWSHYKTTDIDSARCILMTTIFALLGFQSVQPWNFVNLIYYQWSYN